MPDIPAVGPIQPIGVVRSSLRELADAPCQASAGAPPATLELDPRFADALHRLSAGDDVIVLTWLHLADREVRQVHPMGDRRIPLTGVFATRSPGRPNPIGLHRVRVLAVEPPATLRVGALEAVDGTPILDLKIAIEPAPSDA